MLGNTAVRSDFWEWTAHALTRIDRSPLLALLSTHYSDDQEIVLATAAEAAMNLASLSAGEEPW